MRKIISLMSLSIAAYRLALGYIDPNTGGMLFQILAVIFGLLSGVLLFFSSQIRRIVARVRRYSREKQRGVEQGTSESHNLPG